MRAIVIMAVCALVAGCGGSSVTVSDSASVSSLGDEDSWFGTAWTQGSSAIFGRESDGQELFEYVQVSIPDGRTTAVVIPTITACRRVVYSAPSTLADGRLGLVHHCDAEDPDDPGRSAIISIDLASGDIEHLTPLNEHVHATEVAWSPTGDRALISQSSRVCAALAIVDHSGLHPLEVRIPGGEDSWILGAGIDGTGIARSDCWDDGRADLPAWSRQDQVAFFASPSSVGVRGQARLDQPWDLFVMSAEKMQPTRVLEGVGSPTDLAWSADGELLAFGGSVGGEAGTWVFDLGEHPAKVSDSVLLSLDWSPAGSHLAGVRRVGEAAGKATYEPVLLSL